MSVESLQSSYNAKGSIFKLSRVARRPARAQPGRHDRSDRDGGGLDIARGEQLGEFARLINLTDNVATADKFAFDIELRDGRPVRERLYPLAERRVAQHVDTLELDTQMAQHLDHQAGKTALREDRRALHEQHDVVLADLALDALLYWIFHRFDLLLGTVGVVVRAEKMEGNVGLVADHPAVVSGRNVEDVSRAHLGDHAVVHRSGCAARDDDAHMLDRAARRAGRRADMQRPPPAWFIGRAANRHAAYPNNLELALLKGPHFIGLLEALHHHIHVLSPRLGVAICL